MIQTVVVLLFFMNDSLVEHRIQDSLSDCLKLDGTLTVKKLIMK
jgi:hypothetical protein